MKLLFAMMLLAVIGTGGLAWSLGGPQGFGVLIGGALGLGLGAASTLTQRRLLATRPERAMGAFVLGFLTKLMVLLAAIVFFRLAGIPQPGGVEPQAFVLAFLAGVLWATAAGWLGSPFDLRREALSR